MPLEPGPVAYLDPTLFDLTPQSPNFLSFEHAAAPELAAQDSQWDQSIQEAYTADDPTIRFALDEALAPAEEALDVEAADPAPDLPNDIYVAAGEVETFLVEAVNQVPPETWIEPPPPFEPPPEVDGLVELPDQEAGINAPQLPGDQRP